MPEGTAEEAMRRTCEAIMQGDYLNAMADLSAEALADAMNLAAGLTDVPVPQRYDIVGHDVEGGEERFRVRFQSGAREMHAHATWRPIDGAWKIVAIGIDSIT